MDLNFRSTWGGDGVEEECTLLWCGRDPSLWKERVTTEGCLSYRKHMTHDTMEA